MRRYSAVGKKVHDAGGRHLADCRSAVAARKIAAALNAATPATGGPGSVLVRRGRMKGVQVEWPTAPLIDEPRSRTRKQQEARDLEKLREDFDRRVESLLRPVAGKKLRPAIKQSDRRKRFVAEAAAAEREVRKSGRAYSVDEAFDRYTSDLARRVGRPTPQQRKNAEARTRRIASRRTTK